jgi:hypothetical protein
VAANPSPDNPRWAVAERVTEALLLRYPDDIRAIGIQGALAHGDDVDGSPVEIAVVTRLVDTGPPPGGRRISGVIVELDSYSTDMGKAMASTLSQSWPLQADRFLTVKPMYDPRGWHDEIRDIHLAFLANAKAEEFAELARQAWCRASAARERAIRLAEWHDTDGAMQALGEARLAAALVQGLLTRTYFRDSGDAVRRTGLGDAGVAELNERLEAQAVVLDKRGFPVDGGPDDF